MPAISYCRLAAVYLALSPLACSRPTIEPEQAAAVVYVIQRGWHTDIALPVEEIAGPLQRLEAGLPGVRTLVFGFGERQFLVNRHADFGAMLKALLPSQSALLMTALSATPQVAFGKDNVILLRVSLGGLKRIEASIWRQFEPSPTNEPVRLAEGPYPGSVFYAARDTYDAFYTCNTWTAETLSEGGLPVPVTGVLFAGQVMDMVRWISARQGLTRLDAADAHGTGGLP